MAGGDRDDPKPYRHEHILVIVHADPVICHLQNLMRRNPQLRDIADDNLGHHHNKFGNLFEEDLFNQTL